jgi:hypothetical protein
VSPQRPQGLPEDIEKKPHICIIRTSAQSLAFDQPSPLRSCLRCRRPATLHANPFSPPPRRPFCIWLPHHISLYRANIRPERHLPSYRNTPSIPGWWPTKSSCHTTASITATAGSTDQFDIKNAVLGVTCEACYGPGANHVAAMKAGLQDQAADFTLNPKYLDPVSSVDFCGACHRTWEDVVINGFTGIGVYNVRFAPTGWKTASAGIQGDARLTCVACQRPSPASAARSRSVRFAMPAMPRQSARSQEDRRSPRRSLPRQQERLHHCHMPKVETPIQPSIFTDHWIRIVRPCQPYPN